MKKKILDDKMEPIPKLQEDLKNPDPHFRQNAVIGLAKYFENEEARKKLKEEEKTTIVKLLLNCLNPEEDSVEVKARTVKIFKSISIHLKDAEIIQAFDTIVKYIVQKDATGKAKNINAGLPVVIVKGAGDFAGEVRKTYTINKRDLVITPNMNQEKMQGAADPEITFTYGHNIPAEIPKFTGKLSRDPGEDIG